MAKTLERAVKDHEEWLRSHGEAGARFEASVHHQALSSAVVQGADLRGADFSNAAFRLTEFIDCKLERADFGAAKARHITFLRCDMSGVMIYDGAKMSDCEISACALNDAYVDNAEMPALHVSESSMDGARIAESSLPGATFKGVTGKVFMRDVAAPDLAFIRSDFILDVGRLDAPRARMSDVAIHGAIRETNFSDARFDKVDARGASLHSVSMARAEVSGMDVVGGDLDDVSMTAASIDDLRLDRARLDRLNLSGADIGSARFTGAKMARVSVAGANMRGASGAPASVGLVDISTAVATPAIFDAAVVAAPRETGFNEDLPFVAMSVDPRDRARLLQARVNQIKVNQVEVERPGAVRNGAVRAGVDR